MNKNFTLDDFENEIEASFEKTTPISNKLDRIKELTNSAKEHSKRKKPITIRISEQDLEAMQIKASKLGIPYQTYINMVIHKDASKGFI